MARQILFAIQYLSIFGLFVECWFILQKWRGEFHLYILLSSLATLMNNIGYLMQMKATSEETYVLALKMAYVGKTWIPFYLFLFTMTLCGKRVPKAAMRLLPFVHLTTFSLLLTLERNGLYYKNVQFVQTGLFPQLTHENGIWHLLYDGLLAFYIVYAVVQMFLAWRRETNSLAKKRNFMVILALLSYSGFFVLYKLNKAWSYDVTSLGYAIGTVFMYFAIFRYKLLDTVTLAREYAIDELSEGIVAVDWNDRVRYFNKPAEALLPELVSDPPKAVETLRTAIGNGEPLHIGGRVYTPEATPLGRDSEAAGTIFAITDDTEHFRYVRELEEQTRRADSASKAKSAFLANMSHEIRTPINAILGMDEMILRESSDPATRVYAEDIESAGHTLLSIINDILDLSKIEEGKMEILPARYDLSSLVDDLVNMTRSRAEEKGLRFDVQVDEAIPAHLIGDEIRIRQCALNVLTNAVKYTEKGSVALTIGYKKTGEDRIALRFSVSDTGIGMKQEDMERLFTPFARIEEKRNRNIEGTGLGLSITKQLLALMDSRLEVESVYGKGSTFAFSIDQPVADWTGIGNLDERIRAAAQRREYRELFHAPQARILVVDDMPVNLAVIKGLLKRTQITVDTSESGAEALALAAQHRYDAAFIDHMMPEMDGVETLHELRKLPGTEGLPCIALTANAISGARDRYLAAGFSDYLSKPVDGAKLEEMLRQCLPAEKIQEPEDGGETPGVPSVPLPGWLCGIEGLDVPKGLAFCASTETYLETLTIYAQNVVSAADELERCRAAEDAATLTVKVHALKSTSRVIGAEELGALAEKLEFAGQAGDTQTLYGELDDLLARYRALGEALAPLCAAEAQDEQSLPPVTDKQLREALDSARRFAADLNSDGLTFILDRLEGFRLPPEERERAQALRRAAAVFDWDRVGELLR